MASLNRCIKSFSDTYLGVSVLLVLTVVSTGRAEVLPFFDPSHITQKQTASFVALQGFIAEDPLSLKDFFDEWGGDYHPRSGNNAAMEFLRADTGMLYEGYYVGYFYQKDVLLESSRGFVDGYHTLQNDISVARSEDYDLLLGIRGIEQQGMLIASSWKIWEESDHIVTIGAGAYLSNVMDIQSGILRGKGTIAPDDTYSAQGVADYRFSDNLLYDGWNYDVLEDGWGYGFHIALAYQNRAYGIEIHAIVNDLFARSIWYRLPHSVVNVKSENLSSDDNGYDVQKPTVWGRESYDDYTFDIPKKIHIGIQKTITNNMVLEVGYEEIAYIHIPYVNMRMLWEDQVVTFGYETRFDTFSLKYRYDHFECILRSNGLEDASAVGIGLSYLYTF